MPADARNDESKLVRGAGTVSDEIVALYLLAAVPVVPVVHHRQALVPDLHDSNVPRRYASTKSFGPQAAEFAHGPEHVILEKATGSSLTGRDSASGHLRLNPGRLPPPWLLPPLELLSRSSLQLGHVGFQLGYLRLQRAQIGGVGGALEPHQYRRHDLRRQIGAQRLHFPGETIQPVVNTVLPAALLDHVTAQLGHLTAQLGCLAAKPIQPSAHITQTPPYLSHLAAQLAHRTEYVP